MTPEVHPMENTNVLATRALAHAELYDTPRSDDPRRRYTRAQLEIAVAFVLNRTTITDKEVVSVLEEVRRDLLYNAPPSLALRIKVDDLLSHLSRDTDRG